MDSDDRDHRYEEIRRCQREAFEELDRLSMRDEFTRAGAERQSRDTDAEKQLKCPQRA